MTTATAELIEVKPIQKDSANHYADGAKTLGNWAQALKITNQSEYESAATLLKGIKDLSKEAEDARKKITSPLDQAKQAVMDLFIPTATALENCEKHVKSLMISYSNEQERLRKIEEERLRKISEAEAEKERKRLAAIAERAEASGKTEKAEAARQAAQEVVAVAPVIAPTVEKVAGVSMKKNWKARVIDLNKVPREYMVVNESMLDKVAKATKGSLQIAGVEFFSEDVLVSR